LFRGFFGEFVLGTSSSFYQRQRTRRLSQFVFAQPLTDSKTEHASFSEHIRLAGVPDRSGPDGVLVPLPPWAKALAPEGEIPLSAPERETLFLFSRKRPHYSQFVYRGSY